MRLGVALGAGNERDRASAWGLRHGHAAGKKLAVVVEEHDPVAQQAPALFGMGGYGAGGVTAGGCRGRARGEVVTCPGSGSERAVCSLMRMGCEQHCFPLDLS